MKVIDIHTHCPPDDPDMDAYVSAMDECGVAVAVVHGVGEGLRDRLAGNDEVLRAVRRHPGRIIGGAHIDLGNAYLQRPQHDVQAEEGLLVVFPSYLEHKALPYEGERDRIVISFNAAIHAAEGDDRLFAYSSA